MAQDDETISAYDKNIGKYLEFAESSNDDPTLERFLAALPKGGEVLDLGCGPGNFAAVMQARGFLVVATDASSEMVNVARGKYGVDAHQATFDDLRDIEVFDGVWANFSLLHAPREDFERHLHQVATALKQGGHFHIAMKTGSGDHRDKLGRNYTYYPAEELKAHLLAAGLHPIDETIGEGYGLAGTAEPWIAVLAKRI